LCCVLSRALRGLGFIKLVFDGVIRCVQKLTFVLRWSLSDTFLRGFAHQWDLRRGVLYWHGLLPVRTDLGAASAREFRRSLAHLCHLICFCTRYPTTVADARFWALRSYVYLEGNNPGIHDFCTYVLGWLYHKREQIIENIVVRPGLLRFLLSGFEVFI